MDAFFEFWEVIIFLLAIIFFWIIGTKTFRDWEKEKKAQKIIEWIRDTIIVLLVWLLVWEIFF